MLSGDIPESILLISTSEWQGQVSEWKSYSLGRDKAYERLWDCLGWQGTKQTSCSMPKHWSCCVLLWKLGNGYFSMRKMAQVRITTLVFGTTENIYILRHWRTVFIFLCFMPAFTSDGSLSISDVRVKMFLTKFPVGLIVHLVEQCSAITGSWVRASFKPGARFSNVPKLSGAFSGVTIPSVSQERWGFKTQNLTTILLFIVLKTC